MKTELTTVDFHGAKLVAVRGDTPATTLVAMKPVVEGMGLDWSGQRQKIMRNQVLCKGVGVIPSPSAGGIQDMIALPLNRLSFWLATIQADRILDRDIRAKVIAYQEECADVLFAHFFGKATGATPDYSAIVDALRQSIGGDMAAILREAFPVLAVPPSVPPLGYLRFPDYLAAKGIACLNGGQKRGLSRRVSTFCRRHGFKVEGGFGEVYRGGNAYPMYAMDRWWVEGGASITMSLVRKAQTAAGESAMPLFRQ